MIDTRNATTATEPLSEPNIQPSGVTWVMYTPMSVATVVTVVRSATMAVIVLQPAQQPPEQDPHIERRGEKTPEVYS